ncbi:MAG TPA: hypothetical protein VI056_04525 [Candidatus Limnocylindria bacterium]
MSMSLDGFVAHRSDGVGTPAVLGNPTVIPGVGVTHLRYPVRKHGS